MKSFNAKGDLRAGLGATRPLAPGYICFICGLVLACASGCAGHGSVGAAYMPPESSQGAAHGRPARDELEQQLQAELKRLGKSTSDVTPHAPTGATNAAFDLAATVIDPDGPPDGGGGGILPPTGIALAWTERLIGDYNLDGQVNAQDLAPLGINWMKTIAYDAPALHGGIAYWPTGGPLDGGGSVYPTPPADGSGAQNWRRARVDGKEDGVLDVKDVTPIAVHWGEESTGYRVYGKLPGETAFHILSNPDDAASPLTIPRSKLFPPGHTQVDPTRPVYFSFTYGDSVTALPDGRYEFYTAAYDATTDADGPASPHVAMDITGGTANQPPIAKMSLTPSFAGAPAVVTFDASLSSDPDGSIVRYIWDFDGKDGADWSTADPVPVSCCNGEVDTITPGAAPGPGLPSSTVTVTYERTAGYADYLYPRVTVVDDKGAIAARSAKLGVTGWEIVQTLTSTKDEFNPTGEELLIYGDFGFEPSSGDLAVVGKYSTTYDNSGHPEFVGADMYWRQIAPGDWEWEYIRAPGVALPDNFAVTKMVNYYLYWDQAGQPMVVMQADKSTMSAYEIQTYIARRSVAGVWTVSLLYAGTLAAPVNGRRGASPEKIIQRAPNELALLEHNSLDSYNSNPQHYYDLQYVTYNDGVISVEPVGWPPEDKSVTNFTRGALIFNSSGKPAVVIDALADIDPTGIWWRRRTAPGVWVNERLDHGEFSKMADVTYYKYPWMDDAGRLIMGAWFRNHEAGGTVDYLGYVRVEGDAVTYTPVADITTTNGCELYNTDWGKSLVYIDRYSPQVTTGWHIYHTLIQDDGSIITERPILINAGVDAFAGFNKVFQGSDGQLYGIIYAQGGDYPDATVELLARRVDPRGAP
jgi:hypothetical protein